MTCCDSFINGEFVDFNSCLNLKELHIVDCRFQIKIKSLELTKLKYEIHYDETTMEREIRSLMQEINKEIKVLDLNLYKFIGLNEFNSFFKLEELYIKDSELNNIISLNLKFLKILNLDLNIFTEIGENKFNELKLLKCLSLNNAIIEEKAIKREAFKGLDSLEELFLSTNKITKIDDQAFNFSPKLKIINLKNNPFKIDKNIFLNLKDLETIVIGNDSLSENLKNELGNKISIENN